MVIGFYVNLPLLVNLLTIVYYMYIVFCCLCIITGYILTSLSLLSDYVLTDISIHVIDLVNYYSGSLGGVNTASVPPTGGEPTPGGVPNPGGGPNPPQDPNTLGVVQSSGLPKEDSKSSLWYEVSYTSEDLKLAAGSELINVENTMKDKSLSEEERTNKIMDSFTKVHNELINAKREIANLKKSGNITIGVKKD